jgi:hypothetical protein
MPNIMAAQGALGSRRPTEQRRTSTQTTEQNDCGNGRQQQHAPRVPADPHAAQHEQDRPDCDEADDGPQRSHQTGRDEQERHGEQSGERDAAEHMTKD